MLPPRIGRSSSTKHSFTEDAKHFDYASPRQKKEWLARIEGDCIMCSGGSMAFTKDGAIVGTEVADER
jgi:hypothetical protein